MIFIFIYRKYKNILYILFSYKIKNKNINYIFLLNFNLLLCKINIAKSSC